MATPNLEQIKEDFDKVIRYSQGIPDPKTDKLFAIWAEKKAKIIHAFGNKYIYEYPEKVSFELGESERHQRLNDFITKIAFTYDQDDLSNFIEDQMDGFYKNITVKDYHFHIFNSDGYSVEKTIKKGTKLIKAFKYFITDDKKMLFDLQNEASRLIQENKIEGTLCFSVHPLDFLSVSENTYNWRSCHSLDGEYRAGNLSYMMDDSTIVCYLKGEDDVILPGFGPEVKWNSKKWRVLLYLSNDWKMIIAGRPYPFKSKTAMQFVLENIEKVFPNNRVSDVDIWNKTNPQKTGWTEWNEIVFGQNFQLTNNITIVQHSPLIAVGHTMKRIEEVVQDAEGAKQFNDVLMSTCYTPIFTAKYKQYFYDSALLTSNDTHFTIGGYTYCLWCGERECLNGADTMMCMKCELEHGTSDSDLFSTCDCCGCRVAEDDLSYIEGDYVCPTCLETECKQCEHCGDTVFNNHITYNKKEKKYLCFDCNNNI